jgi:hypothetical protein
MFRCCSVNRCGGDHDNHQATPITHVKPSVVGGRRVETGVHVKVSQQQAVQVAFSSCICVELEENHLVLGRLVQRLYCVSLFWTLTVGMTNGTPLGGNCNNV